MLTGTTLEIDTLGRAKTGSCPSAQSAVPPPRLPSSMYKGGEILVACISTPGFSPKFGIAISLLSYTILQGRVGVVDDG